MAVQGNRFLLKILTKGFIAFLFIFGSGWAALQFMNRISKNPHSEVVSELHLGKKFPDLSFQGLSSDHLTAKIQKISDLQFKILMINFWATWCEACISEMPSLVRLHKQLKPLGFELLGINLDENPERRVRQIIQKNGIEFPIIKDTKGKLADLLNFSAIPLTVIINKSLTILFIQPGEYAWDSPEMMSKIKEWISN